MGSSFAPRRLYPDFNGLHDGLFIAGEMATEDSLLRGKLQRKTGNCCDVLGSCIGDDLGLMLLSHTCSDEVFLRSSGAMQNSALDRFTSD